MKSEVGEMLRGQTTELLQRLAGRLVLLRGLGPERETGVEAGEKQIGKQDQVE